MKKARQLICAIALFGATVPVLASCGEGGGETVQSFNFSIALQNNTNSKMASGTSDTLVITASNEPEGANYKVESRNRSVLEVNGRTISAVGVGRGSIVVTETTTNKHKDLTIEVYDGGVQPATGGFNYSSVSGTEAVAKKEEILGILEKYAVDSHLTGITLFENGGQVKYSPRVKFLPTEYVSGFGFGILTDGYFDASKPGLNTTDAYPNYYHSAQTSNPNDMNAWNASGSQISDLASYVTASYWSTQLNDAHNKAVWYPQLAADTYIDEDGNEKPNDRPVPVYEKGHESDLGLYRKWRIYVKTDDNMSKKGKHYRYHSTNTEFDGQPVTIEDYEFTYRMLLTGSSGMSRGTEMAGDKTYGIKGAQAYWKKTKDVDDETALKEWKKMQDNDTLGIHSGVDKKGNSYIELELVNDVDAFTAMYTLSSSLVAPMKESFILSLGREAGNETIKGGLQLYGKKGAAYNLPKHVLSCGPYMLKEWGANNTSDIVFSLNSDWFEIEQDVKYRIPGVYITTYDNAKGDDLWKAFEKGMLDSCGVPISMVGKVATDEKGTLCVTKGDSTFKLNVNSLTQTEWNKMFGPNGTNPNKLDTVASDWGGVKPWMSNGDFLNGLYWSINRKEFANNRGVNPSIDYFSNAYYSDPENLRSYNDSKAHKDAVKDYHNIVDKIDPNTHEVIGQEDDYGFNLSEARKYFKKAVDKMLSTGQIKKGDTLKIFIRWMNKTDLTEYGEDIISYFTTAFNHSSVALDKNITLEVEQNAPDNWEDVYNLYMMTGQFDLAFGAISGNTYNPLNFLEVLKSDNSSGFTLNWGPDTGKVDEKNPIIYDNKKWSFDALWECADRGGVVNNGVIAKTVEHYHLLGEWNDLKDGGDIQINVKFIDAPNVETTIDKFVINVSGGQAFEVPFTPNGDVITLHISKELGNEIYEDLNSAINKKKQPGDTGYIEDLFVREKFNLYYSFDMYYTLRIANSSSSQSMISIVRTEQQENVA